MAGLWAQYHSALGLAKGKSTPPTTRDQSVSKLLQKVELTDLTTVLNFLFPRLSKTIPHVICILFPPQTVSYKN